MIGYATLGTNDLARATAFYDALLAEMGAKRMFELERGIIWGTAPNRPSLGVLKPFNGEAATAGNGTMIALMAESTAQVQQVHAKALALGGTNEGDAGPRGTSGFYGAYFRDLDGNKLCVFCYAR